MSRMVIGKFHRQVIRKLEDQGYDCVLTPAGKHFSLRVNRGNHSVSLSLSISPANADNAVKEILRDVRLYMRDKT